MQKLFSQYAYCVSQYAYSFWFWSVSDTKGAVECVWPGLLIWTWNFQFFSRNMHAAIFICNMHIATCNIHIAMQYIFFSSKWDSFSTIRILRIFFCNKHIACRNMHIARESILRLTHALDLACKSKQYNTIFYGESVPKIFVALP